LCVAKCDTGALGYISGKTKVTIPWAKLCQDPSSWIKPECTPDGFKWADPSKIRIGDVFRLLDHWRQQQTHHLKPLIWASLCPLLEDVDRLSEPSEPFYKASNDSNPRSKDGVDSESEDRNNARSDKESNSIYGGHHSEEEQEEDYMESPLLPARASFHEGLGKIKSLSEISQFTLDP
jgi:hypothetical protein